MQSGLFLDVVVGQSTTVFELLSSKDKTLLVWRNAFLILDLCLDVIDSIAGLDLKGDGLAGDCRWGCQQTLTVTVTVRAPKAGFDLRVFTKICILTDLDGN